VRLLVADFTTDGSLRGFAQFDADAVRQLELDVRRPGPIHLLGDAPLAMTIDRGPDFDRYQSFVALEEGDTLASAAEAYFERSEQVPTRLSLAVGRVQVGDGPERWRAGGALLQQVAGDAARGDTGDAWERSVALFQTLAPDELVFPPTALERRCGCSRERIMRVLASFPKDEVAAMAEGDGRVSVTCEYCNQSYRLTLAEIEGGRGGGG
jgi:molecular chaperone Hsp33